MHLAVGTARRGWLEKGDVINTLSLAQIRFFERNRLNYMSCRVFSEHQDGEALGVIEIADSIKSMEIRGAGLIARSAADALRQQAEITGGGRGGAAEAP